MRLLFATGNSYKFSEVRSYLAETLPGLELNQLAIDIPEIQDSDIEKVIRAKLEYIAERNQDAFIVDDVSFMTERYKGFPGAYAKFINSTLGYEGWKKLFDEGDPIKAVSLIGLRYSDDFYIFSGELEGVLSFKKGSPENPHAPLNDIILLPEVNSFLGEAPNADGFNNHRMRALDKLVKFLDEAENA